MKLENGCLHQSGSTFPRRRPSGFMETGPIMGWSTANIGYHHIHHLNTRIPFYRLPDVLRDIPELQTPKKTPSFVGLTCMRWAPVTTRVVTEE